MSSTFLDHYTTTPSSVAPYSHPEYKFALDDAVSRLLTDDLHYTRSHHLPDVKMLLGYIASIFAAFGSYVSYTQPFHSAYVTNVLYVCVPAFFVFQGMMLGWSMWVEGDVVFEGVKKDVVGASNDVSVIVSTRCIFPSEKIEIRISTKTGKGGKVKQAKSFHAESVGKWFNADGMFIARDFKRDFEEYLSKAISMKKN